MGVTSGQRIVVPTAVLVEDLVPGSPEWLKTASASKVAAILGLSPWESAFSLWHRMAGNIPSDEQSDIQEAGHYLEPACRAWFTDKNPGVNVSPGAALAHVDQPWRTATPDGFIWSRSVDPRVLALLECKTSNLDWEWGPDGSDQVPPYYRAQAMWQMDVTGVRVVRFSVLMSRHECRSYTVEYDATEADQIRAVVETFMASLAAGVPPPLDGSDATYQAIRLLHPDIDDVDAEIDAALAVRYANAACDSELAADDLKAVTVEIAEAMGTCRRAVHTLSDGTVNVLAIRQTRGATSTPFVKRSPTLTRTFTLTP